MFLCFFRFAYVEFDTADEVKDAVENKQGVECGDRKLYLDYAGGSSRQRRGFRDGNFFFS